MKKILVPCDFSETATFAYDFAADIAKRSDGEIVVLHSLEFPVAIDTTFGAQPYATDRMAFHDLEIDARKSFEKMVSPYDMKEKTTFHFDYGAIAQSVRQFVKRQEIDLVVMGTHGARGLKEFFIGSHTEKVVRFSDAPVFTLKNRAQVSAIHNIVLPTTTDEGHPDFIAKVKELQHFFDATLHILFVHTPVNFRLDSEIRKDFEKFFKHYSFDNYTFAIRNAGSEEAGISNFVHEINADMIAMATLGLTGLSHILSGSVTEDIVNHMDCPVWTYTLKNHKQSVL